MYAAAGGASLASRQARQKQRQKKAAQATKKAGELHQKAPPKQFHNYTDEEAQTAVVVPGLSRVERGALRPPQPPPHDRRHSTSHYHLKEPARARIRESPSISIPVEGTAGGRGRSVEGGGGGLHASPSLQSQLPQICVPAEGEGRLERRCSFVRQVEEMERCGGEGGVLDKCNHMCNFEIKDRGWGGGGEQQSYYTEYDAFGSLDYPFSECSQGRAAWQERERGRRCSISEDGRHHRLKQGDHRWMRRNRIHDSHYGGSSEDDDFLSVYHQSAAANALLYVGLGTTAIGSVIFFVGTGEKGFKTLELRLIGPTLIACGLLCCIIRVLLCACPSTCFRKRKKTRLKGGSCAHESRFPLAPHRRDEDAALIRHKKKVCIAPVMQPLAGTSSGGAEVIGRTSDPIRMNDALEDLKLLPPTKPAHLAIPIIELPQDAVIELQPLDAVVDVTSEDRNSTSKLAKTRKPANVADVETSLSVCRAKEDANHEEERHSGVVLSPLKLGQ